MAFDAFLTFTGGPVKIKGETQDSVYKNAFEISEFSFGAENTLNITSATAGAGAGKATFKEFTVKKQTDASSGPLLQSIGLGAHFSKAQLYLRKSGASATGSGQAYLVFAFGMVAVKSIEWSGATGDDVPTESVVFEFGELFVGYYKQDNTTGALDTTVKSGSWSKIKNTVATTLVTSDDVKSAPAAT